MMNQKVSSKRFQISVNKAHKKTIDRASRILTLENEERITITKVVSILVENYLDQAMDDIRNEF